MLDEAGSASRSGARLSPTVPVTALGSLLQNALLPRTRYEIRDLLQVAPRTLPSTVAYDKAKHRYRYLARVPGRPVPGTGTCKEFGKERQRAVLGRGTR